MQLSFQRGIHRRVLCGEAISGVFREQGVQRKAGLCQLFDSGMFRPNRSFWEPRDKELIQNIL
jgi:hypothetical protein